MNTEKITSLFLLFSGGESAEEFEPIIDLAVRITEKMLNSEADKSDVRADFLAAALANYHVQQLKSAHDRTTAAFTGKMLTNGENSALGYAQKLLRDHMQLCSDIIKPKSFIFAGISADGEGI